MGVRVPRPRKSLASLGKLITFFLVYPGLSCSSAFLLYGKHSSHRSHANFTEAFFHYEDILRPPLCLSLEYSSSITFLNVTSLEIIHSSLYFTSFSSYHLNSLKYFVDFFAVLLHYFISYAHIACHHHSNVRSPYTILCFLTVSQAGRPVPCARWMLNENLSTFCSCKHFNK